MKITFDRKLMMVVVAAAMGIAMIGGTSNADERNFETEVEFALELNDIVDTAKDAGIFNTLVTALTEAELVEVLQGEGPFTVFAPTDEAFAKIPQEKLDAILADKEVLKDLLLSHVVLDNLEAEKVLERTELIMASEARAKIGLMDGIAFINDSQIIKTNVLATNGVIHVIDTVILPSSFSAPEEDIAEPDTTLIGVAKEAGTFLTLLSAVDAAELTELLQGEGPFTLFAPNDEAFGKIPEERLSRLIADKDALSTVLKYHVIAGRALKVADLKRFQFVRTADRKVAFIRSCCNAGTYINRSKVIKGDIEASNGVIHVIDKVLIPMF